MMNRNKGIFLAMDEADLFLRWQLLYMFADIHPRYLKTSQAFDFA
jgi:hypothetical protein